MSIESFGPTAATMGGGFFVGILIGYALKKIIKLLAVIVGLFFAGLAYLQYHQIANINWNKLQTVSEGTITTLSNAIIIHIPGIGGINSGAEVLAMYDDKKLTFLCYEQDNLSSSLNKIWKYQKLYC